MSHFDEQLPERLKRDLGRLSPSLPGELSEQERELLALAHGEIGRRKTGNPWKRWMAASAVAAGLIFAVGLGLRFSSPPSTVAISTPPTARTDTRPTIVHALAMAKRLAARQQTGQGPTITQSDIDRIAYAAVTVSEVSR